MRALSNLQETLSEKVIIPSKMEFAERPRITKLSGPNFRNWAKQIRLLLRDRKVLSAIEPGCKSDDDVGDIPPKDESPELTQARKDQLADRRNTRACNIIVECCIQSIVDKILKFEMAKEMWDYLHKTYARDGIQQLIAKKDALNNYSPLRTTSVSDVASALDDFEEDIANINPNERPTELTKVGLLTRIMLARGGKYDIAAAQIKAAKVSDYQDIIAHFADIEEQIKESSAIIESARQASIDPGNTGGNKGRSRGRGGNRGGRFSHGDTRTCYHCGKTGHFRRDCLSKKRGEPKSAGPSTGPLTAPGGGFGLSPPPEEANVAGTQVAPVTETSWIAAVDYLGGITSNWVGETHNQGNTWIMDSGCSRHMTFAKEAFVNYIPLGKPISVRLANGTEIPAVAEGTVSFDITVQGIRRRIQLHEVLHVPQLAGSLISVSHLQDRGIMTRTTRDSKMILELKGQVVGVAVRFGRSYVLDGT